MPDRRIGRGKWGVAVTFEDVTRATIDKVRTSLLEHAGVKRKCPSRDGYFRREANPCLKRLRFVSLEDVSFEGTGGSLLPSTVSPGQRSTWFGASCSSVPASSENVLHGMDIPDRRRIPCYGG